jgi:hypothetical protein
MKPRPTRPQFQSGSKPIASRPAAASSEVIVATAVDKSKPLPRPKRRLPQFTIFGLMVLMFVASIGFAPAYYMMRAARGETGLNAVGAIMSIALPMLVTILISAWYSIDRFARQRRRRR